MSSQDAAGSASASRRRLLGATAVMASGTMISRVLGFVRTMLVAFALGNMTAQGDTFTLATVVPNNLYMIFAGGALNTVLVPQIVRHTRADADGGEAFVNRIMTAFLVTLGLITVVAVVFTPQVMGLWMGEAWRADRLAGHRESLFFLAFLTMPQLFFYGAFFLVGQVLNARDRFGPMMWAPIVNNAVQIVVLGAYAALWATHGDRSAPFTREQVLVLGIGSTVGIIAQTLALIPAMRSLGLRFRPRFDLRGAGLGETFHLAKWAIGYVLLTQLAALVVTRLASDATVVDPAKPGPGLLAYNEAYLTWILPHSLLTVSLATALLPSASRLAAAGDLPGVGDETARTLRIANTFIVPASVGLAVLASPFANLVFGNGAGASDWHAVGLTLTCFAVGLVPYTIQYVYLRGFYALEDMRKAFLLQVPISAANALLAWGWVRLDPNPLTVAPRLALCYSASYLIGALLTHASLARRLPTLDAPGMVRHGVRALLATLPGALLAGGLTWWASERGKPVVAGAFLAAGLLFVLLYVPLAQRLGLDEVGEIVDAVLRRVGLRKRPAASVERDEADEALVVEAELDALDASGTLLTYPEPDAAATVPAAPLADDVVTTGDVIDGRYVLDRLLMRHGRTLTWLARDRVLSRAVLVHVLPPDAPHTDEILAAAVSAARVTDSRCLRVLDATRVSGRPYGAFVLCEYAPGQSLELALRQGPLSELEACWLVREVADSLVGMHGNGLSHRRLSPDTVVITASGNVKLVGFLVEAALVEPGSDAPSGVAADVHALGELLYASLLGRWPGRPRYGLPPGPLDSQGRPLSVGMVRAGLSPAVGDVVDRLLNPAASTRPALTSAAGVSVALGDILGGADASRDLDLRLRYPVPLASSASRTALPLASAPRRLVAPVSPPDTPEPAVPASATPVPPPAARPAVESSWTPQPSRADRAPGVRASVPDEDETGALESTASMQFDPFAASPRTPEEEDAVGSHAEPPPLSPSSAGSPPAPPPRRVGVRALAILFGIALVLGLGGVFLEQYRSSRAAVPVHAPLVIVGVRDFDPKSDGGDDSENPTLARLATDGQATTAWQTEKYGKSAAFNGRKPGVGLIVDLGAAQDVSSVHVTLTGPSDVEIRVPRNLDTLTPALTTTQADWRPVASAPGASGEVTLTLPAPAHTRYVLVYVTKLADLGAGQGFATSVSEVVVSS